MARNTYTYTCPECGQTTTATAAYQARGRGRACKPCVRIRNGWTCKDCGSADPRHVTPCPAGAA